MNPEKMNPEEIAIIIEKCEAAKMLCSEHLLMTPSKCQFTSDDASALAKEVTEYLYAKMGNHPKQCFQGSFMAIVWAVDTIGASIYDSLKAMESDNAQRD
jgi:hypothetical protein